MTPLLEPGPSTDTSLDLATMFKALGDPTRLAIFTFLRDCCCPVAVADTGAVRPVAGPTVGEVCCHVTGVDKVTSAVSFHVKELRLAGLISVERRGKNMICSVNRDVLGVLTAFFADASRDGSVRSNDCC